MLLPRLIQRRMALRFSFHYIYLIIWGAQPLLFSPFQCKPMLLPMFGFSIGRCHWLSSSSNILGGVHETNIERVINWFWTHFICAAQWKIVLVRKTAFRLFNSFIVSCNIMLFVYYVSNCDIPIALALATGLFQKLKDFSLLTRLCLHWSLRHCVEHSYCPGEYLSGHSSSFLSTYCTQLHRKTMPNY